jgi:Spy/CpxP family protein refolding chaperone
MKSKTLLQLCSVAAVTLLPFSPLAAQTTNAAGTPPPAKLTIDQRLAEMKQAVDLSDDQVAKLKVIFEAQKAAAEPILKDKTLSKDDKRAKLKPIMADTKSKVEGVLTLEQRIKLAAVRKANREKAKAGN